MTQYRLATRKFMEWAGVAPILKGYEVLELPDGYTDPSGSRHRYSHLITSGEYSRFEDGTLLSGDGPMLTESQGREIVKSHIETALCDTHLFSWDGKPEVVEDAMKVLRRYGWQEFGERMVACYQNVPRPSTEWAEAFAASRAIYIERRNARNSATKRA